MDSPNNPHGVKPGDIFLDRRDIELTVDAIVYRKTVRAPKGHWCADCVRAGTGIHVYPALTSFDGRRNRYRRKAAA